MKVDVYDTVYLSVVQMVKVLKNPEWKRTVNHGRLAQQEVSSWDACLKLGSTALERWLSGQSHRCCSSEGPRFGS